MSRDLEHEIRDRLRGSVLPAAPERLLERARSVATRPANRVSSGLVGRPWQFLAPIAAAFVIVAATVLGLGGRLPSGDPNTGSQGPSSAMLTIESRIGEWCGPIDCAFHVELTGPGGPWLGQLETLPLGESSPIAPGLPADLSTGSYVLRASIHVVADALEPGELEGRDLGTTATCEAAFDVTPAIQRVDATIGFWLDRCSVGVFALADQPTLATFAVEARISGDCGDFGCDYRAVLIGPGGSWPMVVQSRKPASQLVQGPALPPYLPPGAYRLEASSHRMSEEPEPGAGHQEDLGVAGACSAEFVVTPDVERIDAIATFDGVGCAVETTSTARPARAAELRATAFLDERCGSIGGCATAIELTGPSGAWRAGLQATAEHTAMIVGEGLPESLPPGPYTAQAWLLFMSDAILNGVRESFGSESCLVDFTVEAGDQRVTLDVNFTGAGCTIEANVDRYVEAPTPGAASEAPGSAPTGPPGQACGLRCSAFGPEYAAVPPKGRGLRIERVELSDDRRTLFVEFWGGGCFGDDVPWLGRAGDVLLLSIVHVDRDEPWPSGVACVMIAFVSTYHLALPEPFTGSAVRDLNGGVFAVE